MVAHNLPAHATPFIGRTGELSRIVALLHNPACRLLTLTGPGGIGKTRLAVKVARLMVDTDKVEAPGPVSPLTSAFTDGCCFIPLQPLTSSDVIVPAIADALQFPFSGEQDSRQQLLGYLRRKHLLLVLDNFEHLTEGADLLPEMLENAPNLKLLVTSRERLRLREEWLFDVSGLTFPDNAQFATLDGFSAVQLFLQSARRAGYTPLDADIASIVRICQAVEGIPLAVELAAAWVRVMPCAAIAREVERSLDILTTTLRNVPDKHRSMRAAFERSWDLLTAEERAVFRKLSVFRGGFVREAAEQVSGATLAILVSLVDKSLVQVETSGRYDMHELLRQYAAERLHDAGEEDTTVQRHCGYFLLLAERAEAHAFGREQIAWFDRLEADLDNLRVALAWSLETETGLQLAGALGWFLTERSRWNEGCELLERTVAANPDAPASLRAKALQFAGVTANQAPGRARPLLEQALTLARAVNDRRNIAWSLSWLAFTEDDAAQAAALLDESLALFRDLEDAMGITHTLIRRSWFARRQDDYSYARVLAEEAAIRARNAGDRICTGWATLELGMISQHQDHDLKKARSHYDNSLSLFHEARIPNGYIRSLIMLAETEDALGNLARAQVRMDEIQILLRKIEPHNTFVRIFLALRAGQAGLRRQFERAATLLGSANSKDPTQEGDYSPVVNQVSRDGFIAEVRAELGETAFAEAWAEGNAMTQEQAIRYALEGRSTPIDVDAAEHGGRSETASPASQSLPDPLNARELEVLSLVASGLSNREIAAKLFITVHTVKWYLKGIFGKLQVANRAHAVARAQALGMFPRADWRIEPN